MDLAEVHYIAEGFIQDSDAFLEEYSKLETFDYKAFTEIWKKRLFSLVYMGRETESELFEFTQEIFAITLNHIKPSISIYRRTGALYMLYGLYVKQPLESKCKIRIVTEQWNEIAFLYNFAKRENIRCLAFSILKLLSLRAFYCVALNKLMGPKSTMTWELLAEDIEGTRNLKRPLEAAIVTNDFENLNIIHHEYENKIKDLAAKTGMKMNYDLFENKYKAMESELEKLLKTEDFDSLISSMPSSSGFASSSNSIGIRRSELKRKQFQASCKNHVKTRMNELLSSGTDNESLVNVLQAAAAGRAALPSKRVVKMKRLKSKKQHRKPPKGERKRGRPRKIPIPTPEEAAAAEEEEEEEETECIITPSGRRWAEKPKRMKQHYEGDSYAALREAAREKKYGKAKVNSKEMDEEIEEEETDEDAIQDMPKI